MTAAFERLPWEPLGDVIARIEVNREPCGRSPKAIARVLDRSPRMVYRWRRLGLTVTAADELCHRIGRHPAEIWPDAWVAEVAA